MTVPMRTPPAGDIMEQVLLKGDIGKLTPDERVRYYGDVCRSMGLNPLTKPFEFIVLNGKLQFYALRSCTDQLRKINSVSLEIVSREVTQDILTIHVRARLPDGRSDEDLGAVAFPDTLRGEARANAELKAVTKAKRRATLSICGLGWLDETEIEDIPASAKRPGPPAPNVMWSLPPHPPHDQATGEVIEDSSHAATEPAASSTQSPSRNEAAGPFSETDMLASHDKALADAAEKGMDALKVAWATLSPPAQSTLKVALDRRHKPNAMAADLKRQADAVS